MNEMKGVVYTIEPKGLNPIIQGALSPYFVLDWYIQIWENLNLFFCIFVYFIHFKTKMNKKTDTPKCVCDYFTKQGAPTL